MPEEEDTYCQFWYLADSFLPPAHRATICVSFFHMHSFHGVSPAQKNANGA